MPDSFARIRLKLISLNFFPRPTDPRAFSTKLIAAKITSHNSLFRSNKPRWDSHERQSWRKHPNQRRCIATPIHRSAVNRSTSRTIMSTTCRRRRSSFKEATIYRRLRRRCNCNCTPRVRAIRLSRLYRRRRRWTMSFADRGIVIVIWRIITEAPPLTGDTPVFRWRNLAWLTASPCSTSTHSSRTRETGCRAEPRPSMNSFRSSRCNNVPHRRPTKTIEEGRRRGRTAVMPGDTRLYRVIRTTRIIKTARNGATSSRRRGTSTLRRVTFRLFNCCWE